MEVTRWRFRYKPITESVTAGLVNTATLSGRRELQEIIQVQDIGRIVYQACPTFIRHINFVQLQYDDT